jgi:5'(3')-deoxyribonucleotidase
VLKKLEILCDMDQIISDLHGKWLPALNEKYGYTLTVNDLTNYNVRKIVPCGEKADEMLGIPGFYRDLKPIVGGLETLREWHDAGHDIVIVTSPGRHPECVPDKAKWLDEHLPFLGYRRRLYGSPKEMVQGDVFIDDGPENIIAYRRRNPTTPILTIAHPYNAHCADLVNLRADGWNRPAHAWAQIRAYVNRLAMGEASNVAA